jgi:beta-lactamase regulating signal transducer with metallopeptidase domain
MQNLIFTDLITSSIFLATFAKFLIGSTLILSTIFGLEKLQLLKTPAVQKTAWKTGYIACFLTLFPLSLAPTNLIDLETEITSPIIQSLRSNAFTTSVTKPENIQQNVQISEAFNQETLVERARQVNDIPNTPASHDNYPQKSIITQGDIITLVWIIIISISLLLLCVNYRFSLKAIGQRHQLPTDNSAHKIATQIMAKAGLTSHIRLTFSHTLKSPICISNHEICLPIWATASDIPHQQLESLLAHEFGHIASKDPFMLLATSIIEKVFFFQPLFRLSRNRLVALAEFNADTWAVNYTRKPYSFAETLYTCAKNISGYKTYDASLHAAMAENTSLLRARVTQILKTPFSPFGYTALIKHNAISVSIVLMALMVPNINVLTQRIENQLHILKINSQNSINTTQSKSKNAKTILNARYDYPSLSLADYQSLSPENTITYPVPLEGTSLQYSPKTPDVHPSEIHKAAIAYVDTISSQLPRDLKETNSTKPQIASDAIPSIQGTITFSKHLSRYIRIIANLEAAMDKRVMRKRKIKINPFYDYPNMQGVEQFDLRRIVPILIDGYIKQEGIQQVHYKLHLEKVKIAGYSVSALNSSNACRPLGVNCARLGRSYTSSTITILNTKGEILSQKKMYIDLEREIRKLQPEEANYIDEAGMKSLITIFCYRTAEYIQKYLEQASINGPEKI